MLMSDMGKCTEAVGGKSFFFTFMIRYPGEGCHLVDLLLLMVFIVYKPSLATLDFKSNFPAYCCC